MVTPFLKTLNTEGGTLYTFPSASLDLTKTFVSNDYEFKFSHFACLNLPDIFSGEYDGGDKGLYLETFFKDADDETKDEYEITWTDEGMNKIIAEYLQNYVMNFETAILNGAGDNDDYDNDILTTVSEKVFFNWLQKMGGIKFNGREEEYSSLSDRTVQYIGDIDIINTVEVNGDSFEELYIYIPSDVGASTDVYFRPGSETDNKNYLNKDYVLGSSGESCILGRQWSDSLGLSLKPIVDDENGNIYTGDTGYTIDFRDSSYADGDGITTMNGESSSDFEFNAILIYYDLYAKTDDSNVKRCATNLYGILFLDDVKDINGNTNDSTDNADTSYKQGYFQRYPKKKETVYGNGNSFAFKVDLKIDTIPDYTSTVNHYIDPNTPEAMNLYETVIGKLQDCTDLFYTQENDIIALTERVTKLENMLVNIDNVHSLQDRIDELTDTYNYGISVDTDTLQGLIDKNSDKLDSIINGKSNVSLQCDMDVIQPGIGISISKDSADGSITISSDQKYSINWAYSDIDMLNVIDEDNPVYTGSVSEKNCYVDMKRGENFMVLYFSDNGDITTDINVIIDDSEYPWEVGQSMKIYLKCDGNFQFSEDEDNGIYITIKSSNEKIEVTGDELGTCDLIEIICIDDNKYIYLVK